MRHHNERNNRQIAFLTKGSSSIFLLFLAFSVLSVTNLHACTAVYLKSIDRILVANNEDGNNPETRIWTIPGETGKYGRLYFGYNDLSAQGGVNEKGLWFDAFGLPYQVYELDGEIYPGDLHDKLLSECATISEVLELLGHYNRSQMTRYQWMIGDKYGNAIIVEGDTIIRNVPNEAMVITNFRQSQYPDGNNSGCMRYSIARQILNETEAPHLSTCRNILSATHSEGQDVTLYSYIADLTNGLVYLYHFHDYENVVVLDIQKEISKGKYVYDLKNLFPLKSAAYFFEGKAKAEFEQRKAARRFIGINQTMYKQFTGEYVVENPNYMGGQVLTISLGNDCLHLQLNHGGYYDVIPDSPNSFVLMGYGGLELYINFLEDANQKTQCIKMEGSGLELVAYRIRK
jgi:hypothetical protein